MIGVTAIVRVKVVVSETVKVNTTQHPNRNLQLNPTNLDI